VSPDVAALLAELEERGISIRPIGPGKLRISPLDAVDPDLVARLRAAKAQLLVALTGCHPCDRCGRFAFAEPTTCWWCASVREARA
jgi:hypothetical protein